MRSPAIAIAWQVWSRHRLGLQASLAGLAVMILAYPLILPRLDHQVGLVAGAILPAILFSYVGNLLIFSDEVGSLTSGYPRHMFTLPIPSRMLAFWPMSLAVATMTAIWCIVSLLAFRRCGFDAPVILPAIGGGLLIAWFQVVSWLPVAGVVTPYLAVGGAWLFVGAPFLLRANDTLSDATVSALGLAAFPLLYLAGCFAVRHARRGDRWELGVDRMAGELIRLRERHLSRSRGFGSPREAQLWFDESCQSGFVLGLLTIQNLIVTLFALFSDRGNAFAPQVALAVILSAPMILSASLAGTISRWSPIWVKRRDGIAFLAVRPMPSEVLISTKYRIARRLMWKSWAIAAVFAAALILGRRDAGLDASLAAAFQRALPGWKGCVAVVLGVPLVLVVQWKLITDNLVPAFTGRRWIADGMVFVSTALILGAVAVAVWCAKRPEIIPAVLAVTAWGASVLAAIRVAVAAVALRIALGRGFLSRRGAARMTVAWALAAAATVCLAVVFLPGGMPFVPRPVLVAAPLCVLPIARFGLAPLALDWNRHR
ncbi:hypothetical protein OJF2_20850 [Aquisphaera giovannonii]|uniref:Uncharacterized protein n=1 Tax=Aquisphaera giovannonii TaxID=406548 RepID=A0A5B9VZ37_9BACT|nr:hypothetical protein [Aquisphaera giovannonii]QEH33583.1 hypothetical protein OJF2_20850 [Aquisphaera giovannonii]